MLVASEPKTVRWPTRMFSTKCLREQPLAQPLGERFKWQERCKEELMAQARALRGAFQDPPPTPLFIKNRVGL